eukprot:1193663-Prorocentrum_minimum.AAC.3
MKPLTEKVNALSADLELVKSSQRSAEDLMISGLEKLEKDLREKLFRGSMIGPQASGGAHIRVWSTPSVTSLMPLVSPL